MRYLATAILILAAFLLSACVQHRNNNDFYMSGSTTQEVVVDGVSSIIIRCYCPTHAIHEVQSAHVLQMQMSGSSSSQGYHGNSEKPASFPFAQLQFVEQRENGKLLLSSREIAAIHGAFTINTLEVTKPIGLPVTIESLSYSELLGRHIQ